MKQGRLPADSKLSPALLSFGFSIFTFFLVLILNDLLESREYHLGDSLYIFIWVGFFAAPLLIWHLFDLVESSHHVSNIVRNLTAYPVMLTLMAGASVITIATLFGVGEYNSCDELDGALFHSCKISISLWITIPLAAVAGVAWLLSAIKALQSIWSRIQKSK